MPFTPFGSSILILTPRPVVPGRIPQDAWLQSRLAGLPCRGMSGLPVARFSDEMTGNHLLKF